MIEFVDIAIRQGDATESPIVSRPAAMNPDGSSQGARPVGDSPVQVFHSQIPEFGPGQLRVGAPSPGVFQVGVVESEPLVKPAGGFVHDSKSAQWGLAVAHHDLVALGVAQGDMVALELSAKVIEFQAPSGLINFDPVVAGG